MLAICGILSNFRACKYEFDLHSFPCGTFRILEKAANATELRRSLERESSRGQKPAYVDLKSLSGFRTSRLVCIILFEVVKEERIFK